MKHDILKAVSIHALVFIIWFIGALVLATIFETPLILKIFVFAPAWQLLIDVINAGRKFPDPKVRIWYRVVSVLWAGTFFFAWYQFAFD